DRRAPGHGGRESLLLHLGGLEPLRLRPPPGTGHRPPGPRRPLAGAGRGLPPLALVPVWALGVLGPPAPPRPLGQRARRGGADLALLHAFRRPLRRRRPGRPLQGGPPPRWHSRGPPARPARHPR